MLIPIILLIVGFVILILGAEVLVRGSASLARKLGMSSIVVGLTVVAFGTSAPELIVNLFSAFKNTPDIAIGNIVGSNIANIYLILGISAIIMPLKIKEHTTWKEIPLSLLAVLLVYIMGNDIFLDHASANVLSRTDGLILLAFFGIFMSYIFSISNTETNQEDIKTYPLSLSIIFVVLGIFSLFIGGKLLVDNAVILATLAGISQTLIGVTIVAIGTSLPELATSVVAAMHKESDIAVGNIVGSNIFNVFWILGLTGTISKLPFNNTANIDVLIAISASLLLFIIMFIGRKHTMGKWEGVVFLTLYISYIAYVIDRG